MSGLYGLLGLVVYVVAIYGIVMARDRGLEWRFQHELGSEEETKKGPLEMIERRLGRFGAPLVRQQQLNKPERREKLRQKIDAAGRPGGLNPERYAQRKGGIAVLTGALVLILLISGSWLSAAAMAFLGLFAFDAWLEGTARRRQAAIERELPDLLDILAVCVSAGIAFRPALTRVVESGKGPLQEEMETVLRQIALGSPRREAFEALRQRNTTEGIGTFVTAVQQAEELGVPITNALVELGRDMRQAAFQHARRRAQQAAPKVSVVTTLVIAPGAIIIIMASIFAGFDFGAIS